MAISRNVASIIVLEVFWAFGVTFVSFDIISAFIYSMEGGAWLVALASTVSCLLLYAPQILVPYFQQRVTHPVGGSALGQAFIVAGYTLMAITLATTHSRPILLTMVVTVVGMHALGNAFAYPFYQQLRLRLFPSRTRSASYSTVLFFSQIAGTVGAALSIPLLNAGGGPTQRNYFWCFVVASVLGAIASLCFAFMRDPAPTPEPAVSVRPLSDFLAESVKIFRGDGNLRAFVVSEWMNWLSSMGSTFITFYAVGLFGEFIAAECNFVRVLGAILAVPIAHLVVSRISARAAIITFYLCSIALYLVLLLPPARWMILFATFLVGCAVVFRVNYMFHYVTGICPHDNKSTYYAICNTAVSPITVIGPLLGGLFVNILGGYRPVFAVAIAPLLVGLFLAWKVLKDPIAPSEEISVVPRVALKRMTN